MPIAEITPAELQQLLSGKLPPTLIDVREGIEAAICAIEGSVLIPMNTLPQRLQEIPRDRPVALYCHHGMRSMMAGQWLAQMNRRWRTRTSAIHLRHLRIKLKGTNGTNPRRRRHPHPLWESRREPA